MRLDHKIGWSMNGFDLSGTDQDGVRWLVKDVQGWDDPPASSGGVNNQVMGDGGWVEPVFLDPVSLVLKARLLAPRRAVGKAAALDFKSAIPVREIAPLVLSDGGTVMHRLVRQEGKPSVQQMSDLHIELSLQLVAPDPRRFGGDGAQPHQFQENAFLPVATGGLQLPLQLPARVSAEVVSGTVLVQAQGDAPPRVLVRIKGPAVGPVLRDERGGVMPLDVTLTAGQWIDVDLDKRTIKINSTVNRRNLLRGPWIAPRAGMVLSLDASVYNPLTSMTVFWTEASY